MAEPRKPVVTTAGLPPQLAKALEPLKQNVEMLTGARSGIREIKGLSKSATLLQVIDKVNAIIARLNATGKADV